MASIYLLAFAHLILTIHHHSPVVALTVSRANHPTDHLARPVLHNHELTCRTGILPHNHIPCSYRVSCPAVHPFVTQSPAGVRKMGPVGVSPPSLPLILWILAPLDARSSHSSHLRKANSRVTPVVNWKVKGPSLCREVEGVRSRVSRKGCLAHKSAPLRQYFRDVKSVESHKFKFVSQ